MANRTVKDAQTIKGTNPQYLVEKIIRTRIYDCKYWKEECFALTAELLVDKAMELRYVAGTYAGNIKPSPFLCLCLKMLQIQPEKDIIIEFIKSEDYKYVRALGAFYLRLTGSSLDCYKYLEPLLNDYRKIRMQNRDGSKTSLTKYLSFFLLSFAYFYFVFRICALPHGRVYRQPASRGTRLRRYPAPPPEALHPRGVQRSRAQSVHPGR